MTNIYYSHNTQMRNPGSSIHDEPYIKEYFSKNTVDHISQKVTQGTKGVEEYGRDIIVPDDKILWVMDQVYESYNFQQGFDTNMKKEEYINNMIGQTIVRIIYDIKNVLGYEQCMNKYSIYSTVYGELNDQGLRAHAPIKLKEKRPNSFEFHMRY